MSRRFVVARLLPALAAVVLTAVPAWAASPRLTLILPRGIQRGAEHEVTFRGSNLGDAQEILFYSPGFEVTKLEGKGNTAKATIKVAADCRLGEHVAQIRCASGISDYRTFFVEALPAVAEKEPNSDFEEPQEITLNSVVAGVVQDEDVDYYVLNAKKGERISAEVFGMRLGTTLFDPYVAILDSKRFVLSSGDDTTLVHQDSVAAIVAPEDGRYYLEVRESAYGGNGNCRYRLHVGGFPRPMAVYPAGGKLGEELEVTFLGDPAGPLKQTVKLPAAADPDFGLFPTDAGGIAPSPNPFRMFAHGNAFEAEPNEEIAQATPVELPLAFNGIVEKDGDIDCFKFTAKKGQSFEVECFARRVRSPLDSVMTLYNAKGRRIASNDDSRGPDSYFRFKVPADGEYVIRVTDHLDRGGADYIYRIEFQSIEPQLTLGIPRVERYGQYRQTIFVPRGNRFGTLISASRRNFSGDLVLDGKDLPAGVTMHAEPMPSGLNTMPVVFEAAADAPIAGKLIDFTAHHADPEKKISGGFSNNADFVRGSPGQSIYVDKEVQRLAIAVVDEVPFRLEIQQPKVPLVHGGSMQLKIVAHRQEGFKEAIKVELPFRPPGVGAASSITIPADKSEGLYPINANGNAQVKQWKIFALGSADAGGRAWVSSQMATLEIAPAFVTFDVQRASCEQGQEALIYCKLKHAASFEGAATAKLLGLPPKTATKELEFNKETQELTFTITTEKDVKAGKFKNLICQVTITKNGEPIVSRAGTTELQIDVPLPEPVAKADTEKDPKTEKPKAEKPKVKEKPPKPLTRLEKLRLAAKQRAEAKAKKEGQPAGGGK